MTTTDTFRLRRGIALAAGLALTLLALVAAARPASAATTKHLTVRFYHARVTLTVPSSWHVSKTQPTANCGCGGDYRPVCIVASGDYGLDPYNCELVIGGNLAWNQPDRPVPDWRLPKCSNWTTSYDAGAKLGRTPADYRIFLDRCHTRKSEQWTSATAPSIAIWHPLSWGADDKAAAAAARGAHIVTKSRQRPADLGYVRDLVLHHGRAYVSLDRVVWSLDGSLINDSHRTYTYRLTTSHHRYKCVGDWPSCAAHQLRHYFLRGDLSRHALWVQPADADGTGYTLEESATPKFESTGDPGKCGC